MSTRRALPPAADQGAASQSTDLAQILFGESARYRFNRTQYHRMGELGLFAQTRVELLGGVVVESAHRLQRPYRPYAFSRKEYELLAEAGLFGDQRVELLDGVVVTISPQGNEHAHALQELTMILAAALNGRAKVRVQLPLAVNDAFEPEPDVSVVAIGDYLDGPPRTALLVVEAANDSLHDDRVIKGRLYAEVAVPEYWLIDLRRRRVERYLAPRDGIYTELTTHGPGEALNPLAFPDVTVALDEILPRDPR